MVPGGGGWGGGGGSLLIRRVSIRSRVIKVEICLIYINVSVTKHCQQHDNLLLYDLQVNIFTMGIYVK